MNEILLVIAGPWTDLDQVHFQIEAVLLNSEFLKSGSCFSLDLHILNLNLFAQ